MSVDLTVEEFDRINPSEASRRFVLLLPRMRRLKNLPPQVQTYLDRLLRTPLHSDFKAALLAMPDINDKTNFKRRKDLPRDDPARPMVGFILMVDDFRADNGATRFVAGSHRWPEVPEDVLSDRRVWFHLDGIDEDSACWRSSVIPTLH